MTRRLLAIFIGLSALSGAAAQQDWTAVTEGDEGYSAITINDSGNSLGQFCYFETGNCYYLMGLSSSCTSGDSYPVLSKF